MEKKMSPINKEQLKSILNAIPKCNVRYFLNGLYVNFDKKEIVATNGHVLVLIENVDFLDGVGEVIIPRETISNLIKISPKKGKVKITNSEICIDDVVLSYEPIKGKYPDFRKVMPTKQILYENSRFCWFSSEYVKLVEDMSKAFELNFTFYPPDDNSSSPLELFGVSDDLEITVVLMKFKIDVYGKDK